MRNLYRRVCKVFSYSHRMVRNVAHTLTLIKTGLTYFTSIDTPRQIVVEMYIMKQYAINVMARYVNIAGFTLHFPVLEFESTKFQEIVISSFKTETYVHLQMDSFNEIQKSTVYEKIHCRLLVADSRKKKVRYLEFLAECFLIESTILYGICTHPLRLCTISTGICSFHKPKALLIALSNTSGFICLEYLVTFHVIRFENSRTLNRK